MSFTEGFEFAVAKKLAKRSIKNAVRERISAPKSALYPAPDKEQNVSGSDKYAAATPVLTPPPQPSHMPGMTPKAPSKPRVTGSLAAYAAPTNINQQSGKVNSSPWKKAVSDFASGHVPRKGIQSLTVGRRGFRL